MGEYKSLYEKYYKNVKSSGPGKAPVRHNSLDGYSSRGTNNSIGEKKNIAEHFIKKFIFQLTGALVLIILIFSLKMIPLEGANKAYTVSKEAIDKEMGMEQVAEVFNVMNLEDYKEGALDSIDEFKSFITGEKTIKETIKEEYIVPIIGTYSLLEGEDKGVIIEVDVEKDIASSYDGTIREVKEDEDGKHILIDHGNGIETYYGLLSIASVNEGDKVSKGDIIGKSGVINSEEKKGIVYKVIYMGDEKNPVDLMDFSSLQSV